MFKYFDICRRYTESEYEFENENEFVLAADPVNDSKLRLSNLFLINRWEYLQV